MQPAMFLPFPDSDTFAKCTKWRSDQDPSRKTRSTFTWEKRV